MRTRFRLIEVLRSLWGAVLLMAPRTVLGVIQRVDVDRRALIVARILGARHLAQAGLSGINPSPEVVAVGTWVDGAHSLTAVGLSALDRHRARAALSDAVIAATWALFGAQDLRSGHTPPPGRQRRRDRMAQAILARLPGTRHVWRKGARQCSSDISDHIPG